MQGVAPDEILARVNSVIAPDNDACMFATLFCAVLDTKTGRIEYANGGHNPPLLARKGRSFEYMDVACGFVVGAMEKINFKRAEDILSEGDAIFLYTDGVTEAMNSNKEMFSEKRLKDVLFELKNKDSAAIVEGVKHRIDEFTQGAQQSDDITMLALRFRGNGLS